MLTTVGPRWFNERQIAVLLGVSVKTLQDWRYKGKGPPYVKLHGRLVKYPADQLEAWLASQTGGGGAEAAD